MTIDYKEPVTIRSAAILTTSYVAATTIGKETGLATKVNEYNQLILYVDFCGVSCNNVLFDYRRNSTFFIN